MNKWIRGNNYKSVALLLLYTNLSINKKCQKQKIFLELKYRTVKLLTDEVTMMKQRVFTTNDRIQSKTSINSSNNLQFY